MSSLNPENLSATQLITNALQAHIQAEQGLDAMLTSLRGGSNGKAILLPGGGAHGVRIGPSRTEIDAAMIQSMRVLFQSMRLLMVAVEGIALKQGDVPIHPSTESISVNGV